MSGTASSSVAVGIGGGGELGYGGYKAPFTAVQWQELEHQAMIYKYLVAGLPVPPDLILPIRRSFDALSARFFHHPSLGYCYYGKKFDPEPGRCRRTDGKKWRCSKDAHPDSKYCERHMHRGRNRSRKPVESQSTSQSVSTAMSHISSGCGNSTGSFHASVSSGSFQNSPFYSAVSSEGSSFGSNVTELQIKAISYGIDNKDFRYMHGVTPDGDEHSFSPEGSASVGGLGLGCSTGVGTWRLMSSQVSSSSMLKQKTDSRLLGPPSTQQSMPHSFEPAINATMSKERHHCFIGSSPGPAEQDQQHPVHPFFSEWPTTKESWSSLDDDDGSNKNFFSSTQLSISIPTAPANFSSSGYSTQDG